MMRVTGHYQRIGDIEHFVPDPLPPRNPELQLPQHISILYGDASFALGQLNALSAQLPDPQRFIKAYVIKEAMLSSAIEGIHTTMFDVFSQSLQDTQANKDTQLVLNYTQALDMALSLVVTKGLPIATRVILGAHEALMRLCGEDHSNPGHFRKQAVRVGELVPPPAQAIPDLMAELENYINWPGHLPPLIKAGLVHVQFETIHPFLDGNGRIGRMLIVLMLIKNELLSIPCLYPSYYFKRFHGEYYERLNRVRTVGDYEGWIGYYLKAIQESSNEAFKKIKEIQALEERCMQLMRKDPALARMGEVPYQAFDELFQMPIINITQLSSSLDKSYNTASKIIQQFVELGILSEVTQQKRDKLYRFGAYLDLLQHE